jgi:hypothetical protein
MVTSTSAARAKRERSTSARVRKLPGADERASLVPQDFHPAVAMSDGITGGRRGFEPRPTRSADQQMESRESNPPSAAFGREKPDLQPTETYPPHDELSR